MSRKQRKLRNYLLDRRFQLKYTGMVVLVTVVVASVLGYAAYHNLTGQTDVLNAQLAAQPDIDPETVNDLRAIAAAEDERVARGIVFGVFVLALALGLTGIIVTHRVVGPAYRMSRLFDEVSSGKLQVTTGIRKGDELQDLYQSFADMIESLRDQREEDIQRLDAAVAMMETSGAQPEQVARLRQLVDKLRADLEQRG